MWPRVWAIFGSGSGDTGFARGGAPSHGRCTNRACQAFWVGSCAHRAHLHEGLRGRSSCMRGASPGALSLRAWEARSTPNPNFGDVRPPCGRKPPTFGRRGEPACRFSPGPFVVWLKAAIRAASDHPRRCEMKYMLTIYGNEGALGARHARADEGGHGALERVRQGAGRGRCVHRRGGTAAERHGDDRERGGERRPQRHRRAFRRDKGAAWRLLPDRVRRSGRGARVGKEGACLAARLGRGQAGDELRRVRLRGSLHQVGTAS